jgi:hypothetical protein
MRRGGTPDGEPLLDRGPRSVVAGEKNGCPWQPFLEGYLSPPPIARRLNAYRSAFTAHGPAHHSGFAPDALTTFSHFLISDLM